MAPAPTDYWNQDIAHIDQKFYTGLCILQSAIGDYSIACDLKNRKCLNWSATAYYYSMVHASRLICFLAMGDFPTGHQKLAYLFSGTAPVLTNWLKKFNNTPGINTARTGISNYYSTSNHLSESSLERIGNILTLSNVCRNDSNYEMLIMAHEFNHMYVTPTFMSLTKTLSVHSELIIPIAIEAFKFFIDAGEGTQYQRSAHWYSYLNWQKENEGLDHLIKFIRCRSRDNVRTDTGVPSPNRMHLTKSNIIKIEQWIQPLRYHAVNIDYANEVFENIKFENFNEKQQLMIGFSSAVDELKELSVATARNL